MICLNTKLVWFRRVKGHPADWIGYAYTSVDFMDLTLKSLIPFNILIIDSNAFPFLSFFQFFFSLSFLWLLFFSWNLFLLPRNQKKNGSSYATSLLIMLCRVELWPNVSTTCVKKNSCCNFLIPAEQMPRNKLSHILCDKPFRNFCFWRLDFLFFIYQTHHFKLSFKYTVRLWLHF